MRAVILGVEAWLLGLAVDFIAISCVVIALLLALATSPVTTRHHQRDINTTAQSPRRVEGAIAHGLTGSTCVRAIGAA